ncbi:hypothetical protein [Phaeacidiphilus oryzae]|uniref:hypothetical protein n=1 Tax=Phaeacidiphilus oryzae TaxID=348818 RepID=UPI00068FA7DF|nr:hypothetical protein [Phaeacidiphilus oryzae]
MSNGAALQPASPDQHPVPARLRAALTTALKARDRIAAGALRSALAAVANAEAVALPDGPGSRAGAIEAAPVGAGAAEVARRELTEDQVVGIVRAEVDEREAAAAELAAVTGVAGAAERAALLRAEAAVLAAVLG